MGKSLLDKIQAKLELLRLEKRYTRSRHRRSAFVSNAVYVDGEYVFQTPNSTGSSTSSGGVDALHGNKAGIQPATAVVPEEISDEEETPQQRKRMHRFSTMPPAPSPRDMGEESAEEEVARKRRNRFSAMPGFGGGYDFNKSTSRVAERRLSMIR